MRHLIYMKNVLIFSRQRERPRIIFQVQNVLVEKYGFSTEDAGKATQNFLKSFRKCPENPEYFLHDWRRLLWEDSLGKNNTEISGDIYCQWLDFRYECLAPSAEAISLLESLRENYWLAVITNGPSHSQWEKIRRLQLGRYFHLILVSGDVKWEKPDEEIFHQACLHFGVPANECIMVGDKLETDILGGIKACLGATVWMPQSESLVIEAKNSTNCENQAVIVPDRIIHDFGQLRFFLCSEVRGKEPPFSREAAKTSS